MKHFNLFTITEKMLVKGIDKTELMITRGGHKVQIRKKKRRRKQYIKSRLKNTELNFSKPETKQLIKLYGNKEEEQYIALIEKRSQQIEVVKREERMQELRRLRQKRQREKTQER